MKPLNNLCCKIVICACRLLKATLAIIEHAVDRLGKSSRSLRHEIHNSTGFVGTRNSWNAIYMHDEGSDYWCYRDRRLLESLSHPPKPELHRIESAVIDSLSDRLPESTGENAIFSVYCIWWLAARRPIVADAPTLDLLFMRSQNMTSLFPTQGLGTLVLSSFFNDKLDFRAMLSWAPLQILAQFCSMNHTKNLPLLLWSCQSCDSDTQMNVMRLWLT